MDIEFEKKKFTQALADHGIEGEITLFKALGNLDEKQQYILRTWVNLKGVYQYQFGYSSGKKSVQDRIKDALGMYEGIED